MVVIAIISVFSSVILAQVNESRDKAYEARTLVEFNSLVQAIALYANDKENTMPDDVDRNLPPGLEEYLGPGEWPGAPWPDSVYDWDNWIIDDGEGKGPEQIYQISVRFCPFGQPSNCNFPEEAWAAGFDYHSAVYWCIEGPCRSHSSKPESWPGYCLNCH